MLSVRREAVEDLRYLLSRGYGRISAVKFVGDKYVLDKSQRLLLYRGVYPPEAASAHQRKMVGSADVNQSLLSVDGFNVLWTVDGVLKGRPLYLCDDGFMRDISAIHGSVTEGEISKPLGMIIIALKDLNPKNVHFVFDRLISRSGEISREVRKLLSSASISGDASTASSADFEVLRRGEIAATSDSVMIEKASRVFDLAAYVITRQLRHSPPKI
jgi:hypothetical protein